MENTLENKAKFFALHYGQQVLKIIDNEPPYTVTGDQTRKRLLFAYLELKDISKISDEDAGYCIGKTECNMRKNDPNSGDYGMPPSAIFVNSLRGHSSYHIGRHEADYLRFKGYAVKWINITVEEQVEWGWIKLKEVEND